MQCSRGMFYRKSYTRKGTRVAGKCIRSQTRYTTARPSANRSRLRGVRLSRRSLKNCPAGYIKRASFMRYTKKGKHSLVPEQCIPDIGLPGKGYRYGGPGIGKLRKGELSKHGYTNVGELSVAERHSALTEAIKEFGSLGVWRKLNAVKVYTKNTAPHISSIFSEDMDWIRTKFGLKAF